MSGDAVMWDDLADSIKATMDERQAAFDAACCVIMELGAKLHSLQTRIDVLIAALNVRESRLITIEDECYSLRQSMRDVIERLEAARKALHETSKRQGDRDADVRQVQGAPGSERQEWDTRFRHAKPSVELLAQEEAAASDGRRSAVLPWRDSTSHDARRSGRWHQR